MQRIRYSDFYIFVRLNRYSKPRHHISMKKMTFSLLIMLCCMMIATGQDTLSNKGSSIPSADIKTLEGKIVNSRDILNDSVPIILSFWATWCKPCIKELTAINDEMDTWREEVQFRVVAVSIDDARTTNMVKNLVNAKGWDIEVFLDANSDFKKLMNVAQPPHTFIIYKGEVVYQHTSYAEGDEDELFEKLKLYQP
jgi:cytochrome c biogenesis protein CcmG, thiol:disulfide interchange protein DsbE